MNDTDTIASLLGVIIVILLVQMYLIKKGLDRENRHDQ